MREVLVSIENKMTARGVRTPPLKSRQDKSTPPRWTQRHYKLDSDTEVKSPLNRRHEAYKEKKKKRAAEQKTRKATKIASKKTGSLI